MGFRETTDQILNCKKTDQQAFSNLLIQACPNKKLTTYPFVINSSARKEPIHDIEFEKIRGNHPSFHNLSDQEWEKFLKNLNVISDRLLDDYLGLDE